MKKISFLGILVLASMSVLMYSCKKRIGDNQKQDGDNETVLDYMSTKPGSWWMYASSEGKTLKRVATGRDSVKLGKTYNYYETTDMVDNYVTPEYFGKNGSFFFMLIDLDGAQTTYIPVIINKDSVKLGDTWDNTSDIVYSGITFNLLAEGEVVAVNQTLNVAGKEYTDVMEVRNKLKGKTALTPYTNCGSATMWFKKGVGLIKTNIDIDILAGAYSRNYSDSLIDYHIEP